MERHKRINSLNMDTHNSIMDIHSWIMDIHNSIMDFHNSIMDFHYGKPIAIMPKNHEYP